MAQGYSVGGMLQLEVTMFAINFFDRLIAVHANQKKNVYYSISKGSSLESNAISYRSRPKGFLSDYIFSYHLHCSSNKSLSSGVPNAGIKLDLVYRKITDP